MISKLNLNKKILPFKEFKGPIHRQMPLLINEGRTPISVAEILQERLDSLDYGMADVQKSWWNFNFDAGDGIAYHPNGNIKVTTGDKIFREICGTSQLYNGALALGDDRDNSIDIYNSVEGIEFKRSELENMLNLTRSSAKSNPIWKALVPDQYLLGAYVDAMYDMNGADKNMSVWISPPADIAVARLCCIGHHFGSSNATFLSDLDCESNRLVGLAPEIDDTPTMVPSPNKIVASINSYLNERRIAEGVTKCGLLEAVTKAYD